MNSYIYSIHLIFFLLIGYPKMASCFVLFDFFKKVEYFKMCLLAIVFFFLIHNLCPFFMWGIIFLLLFLVSSAVPFDLLHVNMLKLHLSIMFIFVFNMLWSVNFCFVYYFWWYVLKVSPTPRFYKYSHFLVIIVI